ncbi:hypothetical protein CFOL_v3_30489 [Cephalotus follicularis]|uniref:Uncharacterized protein n=1 Tax=Cephalotus follicularis TaxID=3775 RepID=A0A1Q3D425_CEPFO|nr:hypothetical protein CFOL_v3_30489 [Cephalotus follicularis]
MQRICTDIVYTLQVMSKRCGHLLEENYSASTAKHTAPVAEICSKSCMPPKAFSLSQERTERIMNNPRENSSESGRRHSDRELEELEVAPVSSNKKNTVGEKEPFLVKENVGGAMKKLVGGFDSTDNDRCFLLGEQPNRWTQSGSVLCSGAAEILVEVSNQGKDNTNEVKKQSQRFSLRGSLPQWTDEQLDELFV